MILDCHVHLNDYTKSGVPTASRIERLVEVMRENGVSQSLVLSSYMANVDRPSVAQLSDMLDQYPQLHLVEGLSLSGLAPFDLQATEARLKAGKVVGLKLYPGYEHYYPTDRLCVPVYDLAAKYKVPVMFHSGDTYAKGGKLKYSHPIHLDDVAVDHPDLKVVICHLGNPWFRDCAEIMYKNDNVRADISGLVLGSFEHRLEAWLAAQVRDVILYAGNPEDIMYGTDWPLVEMAPYLRFVRSLELPEEQQRMLLHDNAAAWFNLPKLAG